VAAVALTKGAPSHDAIGGLRGVAHIGPGGDAMDFTLTQYYPTGLDRLWAVFGRPEYPQRKYAALGATAFRLQRFDVTAHAIEVELERDVPVDPSRLSPWVRRMVGSKQTLRHRTRWRRVSPTRVTAELEISPISLPVRARGVGTIIETAPGMTQMKLDWNVTSMVPMVGEKIERLFADQVRTALEDDHAFTLQYLQQVAPLEAPVTQRVT